MKKHWLVKQEPSTYAWERFVADGKTDWVAVELVPVRAVEPPVPLERIKAEPRLRNVALLRQSRLSVLPLTRPEFDLILKLSAEHAENAETL